MTAHPGQNISIICTYPLEYKKFDKYIYKEDSDNLVKDIHAIRTHSRNSSRFSFSYERSVDVLSVHISDVREADGGVYLCGVRNRDQPVLYYTFFSQIRVHVTGKTFIHAVKNQKQTKNLIRTYVNNSH